MAYHEHHICKPPALVDIGMGVCYHRAIGWICLRHFLPSIHDVLEKHHSSAYISEAGKVWRYMLEFISYAAETAVVELAFIER